MATLEEQLRAAEERVAQLKARQADLRAREKKKERAIRNRAMTLWGVSLEYAIKQEKNEAKREKLLEFIRAKVTQAFASKNQKDCSVALDFLAQLSKD